eukprot:1421902-Amphidinium_carterae.4
MGCIAILSSRGPVCVCVCRVVKSQVTAGTCLQHDILAQQVLSSFVVMLCCVDRRARRTPSSWMLFARWPSTRASIVQYITCDVNEAYGREYSLRWRRILHRRFFTSDKCHCKGSAHTWGSNSIATAVSGRVECVISTLSLPFCAGHPACHVDTGLMKLLVSPFEVKTMFACLPTYD